MNYKRQLTEGVRTERYAKVIVESAVKARHVVVTHSNVSGRRSDHLHELDYALSPFYLGDCELARALYPWPLDLPRILWPTSPFRLLGGFRGSSPRYLFGLL